MIDIIQNNPFRVLGVYTSATLKERTANATKIGRYQDVGKSVKFPSDLEDIFGPNTRTKETVTSAAAQINLPNDRIRYALFWLCKGTDMDGVALGNLENGDIEKCKEILGKRDTFSSLLNRSVLALAEEDYITSIDYALTVIKDRDMRNQFIKQICDDTVHITEDELQQNYLSTLIEVLPDAVVNNIHWEHSKYPDVALQFKSKASQGPIDEINALVSQAKQLNSEDAQKNYEMGKRLMACAYQNLPKIKEVLSAENMQYEMTCDTIADQILQCGINYFNNTEDGLRTKVMQAFEVQNFALTIAVGEQAKKRCKENVAILQKRMKELPPKELEAEANKIEKILEDFNHAETSIEAARKCLDAAYPIMKECVKKVGSSNVAFLALSTRVVRSSMSDVIDIVNRAQDEAKRVMDEHEKKKTFTDLYGRQIDLSFLSIEAENRRRAELRNKLNKILRTPLWNAWQATLTADKFPMDDEYLTQYKNNRATLANMCRTFSQGGSTEYTSPTFIWENCVHNYRMFNEWIHKTTKK